MTPITKNKMVFVVDEQGRQYSATYYKRAKGLIKNGRARLADDNTICLINNTDTKHLCGNRPYADEGSCPPKYKEYKSEDNKMSEHEIYKDNDGNVIIYKDNDGNTAANDFAEAGSAEEMNLDGENAGSLYGKDNITANDILTRLDYIIGETDHIKEAIGSIAKMHNTGSDQQTSSKANAIRQTVESREETNRKIIDLLNKMYDDLRPNKTDPSMRREAFELLQTSLKNPAISSGVQKEIMDKLFGRIF